MENNNPKTIPIYCAYDKLLPIDQLKPNPKNNNIHPDEQIKRLAKLIENHGWRIPVTVSNLSGYIVRGHGKLMAARLLGAEVIPVDFQDYKDYAQELADLMADNKIPELSLFDDDLTRELLSEIKKLDADFDMELTGFSDEDLNVIFDLNDPTGPEGEDDIPEPPAEPKSKLGDLYQLGRHRLLCGDSTKREDVERLMDGEKAELLFADPPYGMGKEKDGILNDNLYREKLDAFQMAWWKEYRLFLNDNASAYIWGNAEDLWRLWYCGGLKDSERLTFRNEIIWDKKSNPGINSEDLRSYAPITERCLFFMLGEQGFNNNADNYWEEWTPIVEYLENQRQLMGWSIKDTKRIAGHSEKSGCHWFDKSQWMMPTEEVYKKWQQAANGKAFKREYDELKREYDELKREFYKTRAYFDNTHEEMTDVWEFDRVIGEERFGHASPKSVKMVIRSIKSSSHEESNVIDPFGGTGPALIACEEINRRCFVMELSPVWIDTIIQRWETFTGQKAVKL